MKIPLEEYIPYRISALIVLAVFYGIYLVKQWRQKRRGIRTIQIGRRKDTQTHTVETLMGIATGPGVKFCVSDFRQKSRMALENRANSGMNPLITESHGGQNGMRAGTA